jgi:hypothetical protein
MFQNMLVVMLVNHLAWRNKFLMNIVLTVKKDHQHALEVRPDLPRFFFRHGQERLFD